MTWCDSWKRFSGMVRLELSDAGALEHLAQLKALPNPTSLQTKLIEDIEAAWLRLAAQHIAGR